MGVLEQLRQEANQKKSAEQQEVDLVQQREQLYQTQILPKMQEVLKYLQELVEHLNYLEVPIQVENYSAKYPKLGALAQKHYKINTDGYGGFVALDKLQHINMTFYCEGTGELQHMVHGKAAIEQEVAFLHNKRLTSKINRTAKNINGEEAANFSILRKIPVRVRFVVDYEQSRIKLLINNYEDFSVFAKSYAAEDINSEFLDELARYLLRQDNNFIKLEITDEYRENLRKKLQTIKQVEQHELALKEAEEERLRELEEQNKLAYKMKSFIADKIKH
jgi:hypothetical protein